MRLEGLRRAKQSAQIVDTFNAVRFRVLAAHLLRSVSWRIGKGLPATEHGRDNIAAVLQLCQYDRKDMQRDKPE